MNQFVLYWKRGIVLHLASQVLVYLIGLIFGIGNQILDTLSRATLIGGVVSVLVSWVVGPIIIGWLITEIVSRIKK
jgi:hypothetical protein